MNTCTNMRGISSASSFKAYAKYSHANVSPFHPLETKAGFAQGITIQLRLSRGCHDYTFVLFFSIKDNIA